MWVGESSYLIGVIEDHAVQTVDVESSSFESNKTDDLGLDVVEDDKSVA